jgi:hypothetical protein
MLKVNRFGSGMELQDANRPISCEAQKLMKMM